MSNWKYDNIFEQPNQSVKKQQFITYKVSNGVLSKETVTRNFYGNDYQDNFQVEIICKGVAE